MKILDLFSENINDQKNIISKPYIIAEAGVNHGGDIEIAKRLIYEAKEGGADAIKFQTYRASTLASKNSPSYWDIKKEPINNQYELFLKYDKLWKNDYEDLKNLCDIIDIEFMSTPFDNESAIFLNDLMGVFKISSSDITNKPFIGFISSFGKPIILSTGASNLSEIDDALNWIDKYGNKTALLHCVLNYPTLEKDANLGMIIDMKSRYPNRIIGYSDHTKSKDLKSLEIATILGARILEKHFTYDKTLKGNDHYHSMDKEDLKNIKMKLDRVVAILGSINKKALQSEMLARENARRSIVARKPIPKGKRIDNDDLIAKRPGKGISPKYINEIVGSIALDDINIEETILWELIESNNGVQIPNEINKLNKL